jgi:hypothetical protein
MKRKQRMLKSAAAVMLKLNKAAKWNSRDKFTFGSNDVDATNK